MAPARQAAIGAGLPPRPRPHRQQGLRRPRRRRPRRAQIRLGEAEVVVAGGMESMSNAPTSCPGAGPGTRWATRAWSTTCSTTACGAPGRGTTWATPPRPSRRHGVTREAQDAWSLRSHQRAAPSSGRLPGGDRPRRDRRATRSNGRRHGRVPPPGHLGRRPGRPAPRLRQGRHRHRRQRFRDRRRRRRPRPHLRASPAEWGLRPLARYVASANAALDPLWLFQAPVPTIERLLQRTETTLDDYDLIELNEAFAAQMVADGKLPAGTRSGSTSTGAPSPSGTPWGAAGPAS